MTRQYWRGGVRNTDGRLGMGTQTLPVPKPGSDATGPLLTGPGGDCDCSGRQSLGRCGQRAELVDNLPVARLPAGLASLGGPDGRIASPGITGAHRL